MNSKRFLILIGSILCAMQSFAIDKVLIITHSYCRPDFIELHHKTFKAFLKNDYEYVVFNDASDPVLKKQIEKKCSKLGIRCIRVPQELHVQRNDAGARHIHGIQYSLEKVGFDHQGIVLIIDSDMFLIKPLDIIEFCKGYDLIGLQQCRGAQGSYEGPAVVTYIAPLLTFMNMETLPNKRTLNFDGGIINGAPCDVGGHIYYYLKDNPGISVHYYPERHIEQMPKTRPELENLGYEDTMINFFLELDKNFETHVDTNAHKIQLHDDYFIHYHAGGSNWNHRSQEFHNKKTRIVNDFINQMIKKHGNQ